MGFLHRQDELSITKPYRQMQIRRVEAPDVICQSGSDSLEQYHRCNLIAEKLLQRVEPTLDDTGRDSKAEPQWHMKTSTPFMAQSAL
jgi:hypothetical protein